MYTFEERIGSQSVQSRLRRLGDLTVPNSPLAGDSSRGIPRHNRAIPTLICPWLDGKADLARSTIAITRDVGDDGVGLLLTHPVSGPELLVGYLPKEAASTPWYFLGTIQHNTAIGGGFWTVGVELHDFLSERRHSSLQDLAPIVQKLLPPSDE